MMPTTVYLSEGWRWVKALRENKRLLVQSVNAARKGQEWRAIDILTGKSVPSLKVSRHTERRSALISAHELAYINEDGVRRCDLNSGDDSLLCSLDINDFEVRFFWFSERFNKLYCVLSKRNVSLDVMYEKLQANESVSLGVLRLAGSLVSIDVSDGNLSALRELGESTQAMDLSEIGRELVAANKRRIIRIALESGSVFDVATLSEGADGLCATRRGSIALWYSDNRGIREIDLQGKTLSQTPFGVNPSFSPDGTQMAFFSKNGVFLKNADSLIDHVIGIPAEKSEIGHVGVSRIAWCECSHYFAVEIPLRASDHERVFILCDVRRKELAAIDVYSAGFGGVVNDYLWAPCRQKFRFLSREDRGHE